MPFNQGNHARFLERFGCYEAGDVVAVQKVEHGERVALVHFEGKYGKGNCYAHRLEKIQKPNIQEEKTL